MESGAGGAGDGAGARDGKWAGLAWSSIEMSELRMAGWEGKGGIKEGGLGNSLAGVPCHSPADRQGGCATRISVQRPVGRRQLTRVGPFPLRGVPTRNCLGCALSVSLQV